MARGRKKEPKTLDESVTDYRHKDETRKNVPPAKIAAEGVVPVVPKQKYAYSPRRPPELRFDPHGGPDAIPELIAKAQREPLTADEAKVLSEALRNHQPWLEWAQKREQHERGYFEVDPVALIVHERISTQAILKIAARQDAQRDLFADPQQEYHEAVQFYQHDIAWRTSQEGMKRVISAERLQWKNAVALFRRFRDDFWESDLTSLWTDTQSGGFRGSDKVYVVQTPAKVVQRCVLLATDPGDLVLDPTCGSGTTAHIAEQWGRRWIPIF